MKQLTNLPTKLSTALLAGYLGLATGSVNAAEEDIEATLDEVAIALSHPVSSWITLRNQLKYRTFGGSLPGASDQTGWGYELDAAWPVQLESGRLFTTRLVVPVSADQPFYREYDLELSEWMIRQYADQLDGSGYFGTGHDHLDDISLKLEYGGVSQDGNIGMVGLVAVFPTNQDFSAAREQWLLGGEFALGKVTDWGVIGATTTHVFDVESEEGTSTSLTSVQLFFSYGLGNGWQLISNPKIEYDWEAAGSNKLSLPLGIGVSKTLRPRKAPLKLDLEIQNYVVSPDAFGPDWMLTFTVTPAFRSPFGN